MDPKSKTLTLVIGTVLGALLGFKIASELVKNSPQDGRKSPVSVQQGMELGALALGILRQITSISKPNS